MNPLNALLKTHVVASHFALTDIEKEYLNDIFLDRLDERNSMSTRIIKNLVVKGLIESRENPCLTSDGYETARSLFIFSQGIDGFLPSFCRY